jgi:hypothetical protein
VRKTGKGCGKRNVLFGCGDFLPEVLDDNTTGLYFLVTGEREGRFPAFVLWWEIRTFEVAKTTLINN